MAIERITLCPSAQPDWEDAKVIGVVGGTPEAPETAYLQQPLPVTDDLLKLAGPVAPAEVFRFAGACKGTGCAHYSAEESSCGLAKKTARWVAPVVDKLPPCSIRPHCRWWQQEGPEACRRCPQIVTINFVPTQVQRDAANPSLSVARRQTPHNKHPASTPRDMRSERDQDAR